MRAPELRLVGIAQHAIEPVDLEVARGELVVIVGPSGCGKSTVLRIVAGLEQPSAGRVVLGDQDITAQPPTQRDVAMVTQGGASYPHLTVFENLAFALRMRAVAEDEIGPRVHAAARGLGLTELLERRPGTLSCGQRQRVAIGRALVRAPRVLLFDEPLGSLDAGARADLRRELRRAHQSSGATTLYVTHDRAEAMALADRVVVLGARSSLRCLDASPP